MKIVKLSVLLVAAFAVIFGLSTTSFAFHSGGVAECEGCHSMHNSFEGSTNVTGRTFAEGTGPFLLKASHQAPASTATTQLTPRPAATIFLRTALAPMTAHPRLK
jgi:hypothetical protein